MINTLRLIHCKVKHANPTVLKSSYKLLHIEVQTFNRPQFFDVCIQIYISFISTIYIWNNFFFFFFSLHGNLQKLELYPLLSQSPHKNMLGEKKENKKACISFQNI